MPVGAAEPLIGVFENIAAGKQRAREKQAELSQQELERIAHEHYYDALAKHEANLDEEAKAKLELEKRKQTFLESEDSPAARRERAAFETQQRLTDKQTAEIQRKMEADAAKRWKDSMEEHLKGGNPGLIAGGLPQSEQQKFIDSIKAIQKHEYDTKKAASDAQLAEQIGQLRRSVPDSASAGIFGAVTGGMPDEVEKALIPQIGDLTMQAAKKLGPPPGEDDWMSYQHPAYREKVRMDDAKIKSTEIRNALMQSQEERQKLYLKVEPELAKATVQLKQAQIEASKARTEILNRSELYKEKFGAEKIGIDRAKVEIERMRAKAALNKADMAPALQLQHQIRAIATVDLRHDFKEADALKKQQEAAVKWIKDHKEYEGYKETQEEVGTSFLGISTGGGRKVSVIKKPDGTTLDPAPGTPNAPSEMDRYLHYKALQRDWGKDADKDPDTAAGRLKSVQDAIKNDHEMATIGATREVPLSKVTLPAIGSGLTKEQQAALAASARAKTPNKRPMTADELWKRRHP